MDLERLERANKLNVIIQQAEKNIEDIKKMFDAKEVAFSSETVSYKIHSNGKEKDELKEVLLKRHKDFLEEKRKEFENL